MKSYTLFSKVNGQEIAKLFIGENKYFISFEDIGIFEEFIDINEAIRFLEEVATDW